MVIQNKFREPTFSDDIDTISVSFAAVYAQRVTCRYYRKTRRYPTEKAGGYF